VGLTPLRAALVTLSLIATVNCGSSTSSPAPVPFPAISPSPLTTSFVGTWEGTANLIRYGNANVQMTLGASGSQLTGTCAMKR